MKNIALGTVLLLAALSAAGQSAIRLPEASPAATVGQTIGITDVAITYSPPAVNKRKSGTASCPTVPVAYRREREHDDLVLHAGEDRRAGVAAGTYALYAIPAASQWTMIFSKFTGDWGVYNYDQSEDALRVTVTPQVSADSQERLAYTFDDVTNTAGTAWLRWKSSAFPSGSSRSPGHHTGLDQRHSARREALGCRRLGSRGALGAAQRRSRHGADVRRSFPRPQHDGRRTAHESGGAREERGRQRSRELRARAASMATEAETIGRLQLPDRRQEVRRGHHLPEQLHLRPPHQPGALACLTRAGRRLQRKGDPAKAKEYYDKAMAARTHGGADRGVGLDQCAASEAK